MSIYLLDKEKGITSNKALSFLKREINEKKAGFSGVLDPFATGLLIVATKGDTRFLDLFLNSRKTYSGTILFGTTTDTLDIDGEVVEKFENAKVDSDALNKIIQEKFIGKISQVPPKYSNIKVDGRRAHELSRSNVEFELKSVEREIYSFKLNKVNELEYNFIVEVSSGTYIRSLARDIGIELGVPAMLTTLRREAIGEIKVPEKTKEVNRTEVVPLDFKGATKEQLDNILNGKKVSLDYDLDDIVLTDGVRTIWVKRIEDMYKIHKNIE